MCVPELMLVCVYYKALINKTPFSVAGQNVVMAQHNNLYSLYSSLREGFTEVTRALFKTC